MSDQENVTENYDDKYNPGIWIESSKQPLNLYKAMLAVQAEATNPVAKESNPFYKSNYATLEQVLDILKPLWCKYGLLVTQSSAVNGGGRILITNIVHAASGESERYNFPLISLKEDPQAYGSATTYARRYSLKAIFSLGEDDDDGAKASGTDKPKQPQSGLNQPKPESKPANHAPGSAGTISEAQAKRFYAMVGPRGLNLPEEKYRKLIKDHTQGFTDSITKVSSAQYREITDILQKEIDKRKNEPR